MWVGGGERRAESGERRAERVKAEHTTKMAVAVEWPSREECMVDQFSPCQGRSRSMCVGDRRIEEAVARCQAREPNPSGPRPSSSSAIVHAIQSSRPDGP